MAGRRLLLAAAMSLLLGVAAAGRPARNLTASRQRKPSEMSPTVSLFFINDVLLSVNDDGTKTSRCIEMVERAAAFNAQRINFVITHYFVDTNGDSAPDWYCLRQEQDFPCEKFGSGQLNAYMAGLKSCFQRVADYKLDIFITPHVNDGSENSKVWRNAVRLDPLKVADKWSYSDIHLRPVAQQLNAVAFPGMKIWFCMQGEMNAAVMNYPRQFTQLVPYLKQTVTKGKTNVQVSVGVCMNFNKLQGMEYMDSPAECQNKYDTPGLKEMFDSIDFLGVSNYPQVSSPTQIAEMETAVKQLDSELTMCGISLKELSNTHELMMCEYGFGGGTNGEGTAPAQSAFEVGTFSYFGILGPYRSETDPWKTYKGESVRVEAREAVRALYEMTSTFLANGGGSNYRIDGLFLWNVASWDLLGIHWRSYSNEGSYYEPGVARIISEHNRKVNNLQRAASALNEAASP